MPNWVKNKVYYYCTDEEEKEFMLDMVKYDDRDSEEEVTGIGTMDFNKIIPMSKTLDIEYGSKTDDGISVYLQAVSPYTEDFGMEKLTEEKFVELIQMLNRMRIYGKFKEKDEYKEYDRFKRNELLEIGKIAVYNLKAYGFTTWYDWRICNWGTKWNSCDNIKTDEDCFEFSTAWSAPHPIIEKLARIFPKIRFVHYWADEDIGNNCGEREYINGKENYDRQFLTAKEETEFALDVWGYEAEDLNLVFNEETEQYEYAE